MTSNELLNNWLSSDPEKAQTAIEAELCRRSLATFFRRGWHVLEPDTPLDDNWHIDAICDHVQALIEGWAGTREQLFHNLLINVPPGTLKSRIVGVYAQAWAWIQWPQFSALFLSSNPRVALRDADFMRQLIGSEWYRDRFQPDWTTDWSIEWDLDDNANARGLFRNTRGGCRQSQGMSAKVTGDRHDAIFVDDPHDAEEAKSKALREAVNDKWDTAICNRIKDPRRSIRCGVMQRLHADDWASRRQKEGWEHLCIRQEFDPKRSRKTALGWSDPRSIEGELLLATRFSRAFLYAERKRLGSDGYAGQHQQDPVPEGGGKFKSKWFVFWSRIENQPDLIRLVYPDGRTKIVKLSDCRWFSTVDVAMSTKKEADYTVIAVWAVTKDGDLILIDLVRDRFEDPEIIPQFTRFKLLYPKLSYFAIESNGMGLGVIQTARRKNFAVRSINTDKDKVANASTAIIRCEAGQIAFPSEASWLADFLLEVTTFNKTEHDDQVDVLSNAAIDVFWLGGAAEPEEDRNAREAEAQKQKSEQWHSIDNDAFF
jgi:predicted phage terminase large subunit-like protein